MTEWVRARGLMPRWTLLGVAMLALAASAQAQTVDIAAVVRALDQQNSFLNVDFSMVLSIVSQDPERGAERSSIRLFRRDSESKFLLLVEEPLVQRGQGYLQDGESLWFYDPESRRFSHMSARENIAGTDARSDDFGQSTLARNYRVVSYSEAMLGTIPVYVIEMEATTTLAPVPILRLWVSRRGYISDGYLLLQQQEYSVSRRLLRTVQYPHNQTTPHIRLSNGAIIAPTMIFIEGENPSTSQRRTTITISSPTLNPLPADVFTKSFVERVSR